MLMRKPVNILLSGLDGSGKTTLAICLYSMIKSLNFDTTLMYGGENPLAIIRYRDNKILIYPRIILDFLLNFKFKHSKWMDKISGNETRISRQVYVMHYLIHERKILYLYIVLSLLGAILSSIINYFRCYWRLLRTETINKENQPRVKIIILDRCCIDTLIRYLSLWLFVKSRILGFLLKILYFISLKEITQGNILIYTRITPVVSIRRKYENHPRLLLIMFYLYELLFNSFVEKYKIYIINTIEKEFIENCRQLFNIINNLIGLK